MAKLPTRDDLGGLPSGRSGRVIADFDVSAVGRGMEAMGKGVQDAGYSFARIAAIQARDRREAEREAERERKEAEREAEAKRKEDERKQQALELATAEARLAETDTAIRGSFQNDPDYATFQERASKAYDDAIGGIAENISDDHLRQMWILKTRPTNLESVNTIVNHGNTLRRQDEVVKLNEALEVHRRIYVDPASTEQDRQRARDAVEDTIGLARQTGLLSPEDEANFKKTYVDDADYNRGVMAVQSGEFRPVAAVNFRPEVDNAIAAAANKYGVNAEALRVIAQIESRGNPNAKNPRSSAGGLFQQIDSNARQYGVSNRFDPNQSADGAARFMRDNANVLRQVLGREPTTGELYLAHQQGPGGASKLLANPRAKATDIVGNAAVKLNGGHPDMTAQQFADLWIRKANSIAGTSDGTTTPDWYKRLSPEDQSKIMAQANDAEQTRNIQLKEAFKQHYDDVKGAYELDIELGNIYSEDDILSDPLLTDAHKADLIGKFRTENEGRAEAINFLAAAASGSMPVNSFDSDQTRVAEKAHEYLEKHVSEDQIDRARESLIAATGYLPDKTVAQLRQGAASSDPGELAEAMVAAHRMKQMAPTHFSHFEGGGDVRDKLTAFEHLVNERGAAPEDAAKRILDMADPEKKKQRESLLETKAVKDRIKEFDADTLAGKFATGLFDMQPRLGPTPAAEAAMILRYREMFSERLVESAGDIELAEKLTDEAFKQEYGVSELTLSGGEVVNKYPPELLYPADELGSHDYIRRQAMEDLAALDFGIVADETAKPSEITDVFLQVRPDTSPKNPVYDLYFKDGFGKLQQFPGEFRADASRRNAYVAERRDANVKRAEQERRVRGEQREEIKKLDEDLQQRLEDVDAETEGWPDWMRARMREREFELNRMEVDRVTRPTLPEAEAPAVQRGTTEPIISPDDMMFGTFRNSADRPASSRAAPETQRPTMPKTDAPKGTPQETVSPDDMLLTPLITTPQKRKPGKKKKKKNRPQFIDEMDISP